MRYLIFAALFVMFICKTSQARVYYSVYISEFEEVIHLEDFKGQSFLSFMKEVMYPRLTESASKNGDWSHFEGVKKGFGVELRLTENITTYHIKYKAHWEEKAERSGRSYAGVDHKPWNKKVEYVADASYKHYLNTLEKLFRNQEEVEPFLNAILMILTNCDSSYLESLSAKSKQVAADFMAVYVAEQYRHLISGKGKKLGPRHNWDDAHLQVTLLAPFHAGQQQKSMFYKGRFTNKVYHQKYNDLCIYQQPWLEIPENHHVRSMNLTDYWQFNKECDRSGVNLTRRDFQKLGRFITPFLFNEMNYEDTQELQKIFKRKYIRNYISSISKLFINNKAPRVFKEPQQMVNLITKGLLISNVFASPITEKIDLKFKQESDRE